MKYAAKEFKGKIWRGWWPLKQDYWKFKPEVLDFKYTLIEDSTQQLKDKIPDN